MCLMSAHPYTVTTLCLVSKDDVFMKKSMCGHQADHSEVLLLNEKSKKIVFFKILSAHLGAENEIKNLKKNVFFQNFGNSIF